MDVDSSLFAQKINLRTFKVLFIALQGPGAVMFIEIMSGTRRKGEKSDVIWPNVCEIA